MTHREDMKHELNIPISQLRELADKWRGDQHRDLKEGADALDKFIAWSTCRARDQLEEIIGSEGHSEAAWWEYLNVQLGRMETLAAQRLLRLFRSAKEDVTCIWPPSLYIGKVPALGAKRRPLRDGVQIGWHSGRLHLHVDFGWDGDDVWVFTVRGPEVGLTESSERQPLLEGEYADIFEKLRRIVGAKHIADEAEAELPPF